jgi:hypothetical protein
MRKTILILALVTITTSLSAQIIEDNRERETISRVSGATNNFASLKTLEDKYYITYRDTRYTTINSMELVDIGDKESYNTFRRIVLDVYENPKRGKVKRFLVNGKYFVIRTFSKRSVTIDIEDGGVMSEMGIWTLKKMNKLLPKLD